MIRIGRLTDYGIMLLTFFLRREAKSVYSARRLSELSKIPLPTVSKLLKTLNKAEIVRSSRGVRGGYELTRAPEFITVLELIAAFEGPVSLTYCGVSEPLHCDYTVACPVKYPWQKINAAIHEALSGISLRDLSPSAESVSKLMPRLQALQNLSVE